MSRLWTLLTTTSTLGWSCYLSLDYCSSLNQFPFGLDPCSPVLHTAVRMILFNENQARPHFLMGVSPRVHLWPMSSYMLCLPPHWCPGWASVMSGRLLPGTLHLLFPLWTPAPTPQTSACFPYFLSLFRFHLPWFPITSSIPCFPPALFFSLALTIWYNTHFKHLFVLFVTQILFLNPEGRNLALA